MRPLLADLQYALRLHARRPTLAIAAVLVLGLGLGANLAVFQLLNTILLEPMPKVRGAADLVHIGLSHSGRGFQNTSYPDFADLRANARPDLDLAAHRSMAFAVAFDSKTTRRLAGAAVSDNYFTTLGVRPATGRFFRDANERAVVISDALWARQWNRDPKAIGAHLRVNTVDLVIVGVAEAGFRGNWLPVTAEFWVPLTALDEMDRSFQHLTARNATWLQVFGRLAPGVARARADARLEALAIGLRAQRANDFKDMIYRTYAFNALGGDVGEIWTFLGILGGITLLASVVVCANVANLLLAAAAARRREIAIRLSVGAGRARVLRLMLVEGLVLALAAAALGLLASQWAAEFIAAYIPDEDGTGRVTLEFTLRPLLAAAALGLGLLATIVIALPAAWQSARTDILSFLKSGDAGSGSVLRTRLRGGLAIVQVALCVVLLSAAGLLLRSVDILGQHPVAARAGQIRIASLDLQPNGYDARSGPLFYTRLLDRLRGAAGIEAVALASTTPFGGQSSSLFSLWGGVHPKGQWFEHEMNLISPRFFQTLGTPLLAGRDLTMADQPGRPPVALINQEFAKRMFPGRDPVGQIVEADSRDTKGFQVIGVVPDGIGASLTNPRPVIYVSLWQIPTQGLRQTIVLRGDRAVLRAAVQELDPQLPLYNETTLRQVFESSYFQQKLAGAVAGFAGVMALLVATIGLYGLIAFQVAQRTREVGLRLALGATPAMILRSILRGGVVLVATGLLLGLGLTVALTKLLSSVLYGVRPAEPTVLAGALALLSVGAIAAGWAPARRATRIDPARALRWE